MRNCSCFNRSMPHSIRNIHGAVKGGRIIVSIGQCLIQLEMQQQLECQSSLCFNRSMPHSIRNYNSRGYQKDEKVSIGQCLIQLEILKKELRTMMATKCFNRSMPHSIRNIC